MVPTPSNTRYQTSSPPTLITSVTALRPGADLRPVPDLRPAPDRGPAPRAVNLFALLNEPEDASLTGGTRSLDRRLLALNISGSIARFEPVSEASAKSRQRSVA